MNLIILFICRFWYLHSANIV